MKTRVVSLLALFLPLAAAPLASATSISLLDFSAFESANTFFLGDWERNGDLGGTNLARASFSQGAGAYFLEGGSNDATASAFYFFNAPVDLGGLPRLELGARRLAGNTASTLTVSLFDSNFESAFAVFALGGFGTSGFTLDAATLTASAGFNAADVLAVQFSGAEVGGTSLVGVALDQLSAVDVATPPPPPPTNSVPDAGASAVLLSLGLAGCLTLRGLNRSLRLGLRRVG